MILFSPFLLRREVVKPVRELLGAVQQSRGWPGRQSTPSAERGPGQREGAESGGDAGRVSGGAPQGPPHPVKPRQSP